MLCKIVSMIFYFSLLLVESLLNGVVVGRFGQLDKRENNSAWIQNIAGLIFLSAILFGNMSNKGWCLQRLESLVFIVHCYSKW